MPAVAARKTVTNRETRKARPGAVDPGDAGDVPPDGEGRSCHRLHDEVAEGARALGWSRSADRVAAEPAISTSPLVESIVVQSSSFVKLPWRCPFWRPWPKGHYRLLGSVIGLTEGAGSASRIVGRRRTFRLPISPRIRTDAGPQDPELRSGSTGAGQVRGALCLTPRHLDAKERGRC
jgi:hypothetical protein